MELNEKINRILDFNDGFYIECGSYDGVDQSNTLILERNKNWKGILIEASESSLERCKNNRSDKNIFVNCILSSSENEDKILKGDFCEPDLMSSINGERRGVNGECEVISKTITSVLKENDISEVDFFSLDVEGHELEVLKGLDFKYCSPKWIVIEIYTKDKDKIFDLMKSKNYKLYKYDGNESITNYNHKDNPYWDGTHNDYLFKLNDNISVIDRIKNIFK